MWRRPRPPRPAAAGRAFGVHRDALQEDDFPIDDDVAPTRLDRSETDLFDYTILPGGEDDLVQPGASGMPPLEGGHIGGGDRESAVDADHQIEAEFGDLDRGCRHSPVLVVASRTIDVDLTGERPVRSHCDPGTGDELVGGANKIDTAMQASEIEPVGPHGWNPFWFADAVHEHDERVVARCNPARHLDRKRAIAALMGRKLFPIEEHRARVVHRTEVNESPAELAGLGGEAAPIPQRGFVVVQLGDLGVPIAGHLQLQRGVEVVLDPLGGMRRLAVSEPAILGRAEDAEAADVVGVGDGPPGSVQ